MKLKNIMALMGIYLIIVISILSMTLGVVAGEDATYYHSSNGNNIDTIMYTEVNWQDCKSATLMFLAKYDIASGDNAYVFCSDETEGELCICEKYTGTKSDWTPDNLEMIDITGCIGYKYIGFWYITDNSGVGDGFFVDNIQRNW